MRILGKLVGVVFQLGGVLLMVGTPALGLWLASSLISLRGGPRGLALVGGLLLFPVLPGLWELRAHSKWKRKAANASPRGEPPKRTLTGMDRLILRTIAINLAFLALLLGWFPKIAFTALATRGDWFLAGQRGAWVETSRKILFAGASGLEWLHRWANPNPYKKQGDGEVVPENVTPVAEKTTRPSPDPQPTEPGTPVPDVWTVGDTEWPWEPKVHPVVAAMTASDEGSIEAVGRSIAAKVPDPFERIKALHDWVVTRLRYDQDSLANPGWRKPQDAHSVFALRTGVCEGYARLMVELGRVVGSSIVYVVGEVREANGAIASTGHAWNAVEVRGKWYILDATWDDPISAAGDMYRSDYLFIPPSVAILDHLPEEPRWQLQPNPLSRGAFMRQPLTGPGLAREGMTLKRPGRSTVEVHDVLEIELENPRGLFVSARLDPSSGDEGISCGENQGATTVRFRCQVPGPGHYLATLFSNRQAMGMFKSFATIDVTAR